MLTTQKYDTIVRAWKLKWKSFFLNFEYGQLNLEPVKGEIKRFKDAHREEAP